MKYKDLITKKFFEFQFRPRKGQMELVDRILTEYIDNKKKHVILSASTGTGKSLIALIVSECLSELKKVKSNKSYILAHTNTLLRQYDLSYSDTFNLIRVMGKNNYNCEITKSTAECCVYSEKTREVFGHMCNKCEYFLMKKEMNVKHHFITNYAYLFTMANLCERALSRRLITIYDEAHLMNEQFVNHMKITLTNKFFYDVMDIMTEIEYDNSEMRKTFHNAGRYLEKQRIEAEHIDGFLLIVMNNLKTLMSKILDRMDYTVKNPNYTKLKKFNGYYTKISNVQSRIKDYFELGYRKVIDIREDFMEISPIFIENVFKKIQFSDYYLFMSATLDSEYLNETMNIPKEEMVFIQAESYFPSENKTVVMCNQGHFNYNMMQTDSFHKNLNVMIESIINEHQDEKGVLLTTNFKLGNSITQHLKKYIKQNNLRFKIFNHVPNKPLAFLLGEFKECTKPSLLISPSLFEGIDLPDDDSRFQIFVKAPFYSLADTRIKYICHNFPEIYKKLAVYRMIQGSGRSVRSENDYCVNYYLDSFLMDLFFSKDNLWKNEFTVVQ